MKKIIGNVIQFRDMYYNNCWYSAIFPIIRHFGGSITPILLEDINIYKPIPVWMERENAVNQDDSLRKMGIKREMPPVSKDIAGDLIKAIDAGKLPMVFIDCFYEKLRPDAVGFQHWTHILTVYGYDDEAKYFEILEHNYVDGFNYERYKMDFDQMADCYNGFVKMLDEEDPFKGYYLFSKMEGDYDAVGYTKECILRYISKMEELKPQIYDGMEQLKKNFDKIKNDNTVTVEYNNIGDKKWFNAVINIFDGIKKAKAQERYNFLKVFNADACFCEDYDLIISRWQELILFFSKLNGKFSQNHFDIMMNDIFSAIDLEKSLLDKIFDLLEKNKRLYNYEKVELPLNGKFFRSKELSDIPVNFLDPFDAADPTTFPYSDTVMNIEGVPLSVADIFTKECDVLVPMGQEVEIPLRKYKRIHLFGTGDGDCYGILSFYKDGVCKGSIDLFFHAAWSGIIQWETEHKDWRIKYYMKAYDYSNSIKGLQYFKDEFDFGEFDCVKMPESIGMRIFAMTLEY
ncbi:MAG: BtrH N-terminal domain-containing protein [Clostridiales bacterium]|jgi:hypothetical protein|nr:BtrH N-terminal domain-containing protein [Clostridiales bacterium]